MPGMSVPGPSVAARHRGPALGRHQLRPAPIELAVIALAHAEIAGPGLEVRVETLVAQAHLRVHRQSPRDDAATGAGAFLPVVHVVLLEGTGGAEASYSGQPDRLLDVRWCRPVSESPRPHLGVVGAARMPDAECAGSRAEHRKIGEGRADDRVDPLRAGPEPLLDLRADLFLVFQNLGHRRVADVVWTDADQNVTVAGGNYAPGRLRFSRDAGAERSLDRREVAPRHVIGIAAEVFGREFPITRHDP